MPEMRTDPITGRTVIIAADRKDRPTDLSRGDVIPSKVDDCPFCRGAEATTPPEVYALRDAGSRPDGPGWKVRIVPNKFPALDTDSVEAFGYHEVVIHSPDHSSDLARLSTPDVASVLRVYRDRIVQISNDSRIKHITVIVNRGKAAGASLAHPHSQIFALPLVPEAIDLEVQRSHIHYQNTGMCLVCDSMNDERNQAARVIADTDGFLVWACYAPRNPYELVIAPKAHASNFDRCGGEEIDSLARVLKDALSRLDVVLGNPPYNVVLHSGPLDQSTSGYYHWHLEIIPRTSVHAGLELGGGIFVNSRAPEDCARHLRDAFAS